ncbi:conserved hypothetical protein [Halorhabdus utahensis DSM 12940]|uniref:DUF2064 domain-containing protein n=1 Tax=Halorhabdus utahensis (strain DSM 12940 / JCM 11049 / AX-2) TaxID=519442 RepID=C7NPS6_HALUD|nr:hypothetical protein [Halorhabdus utahensis]ACV10373.1 conserved hypothetical protein [Halorhabdus utahensis DSM 12940]
MATVVVRADAPISGTALPHLVAETPLTEREAAELYQSALQDVCEAVAGSGADLLVNYRERDEIEDNVEADLRDVVTTALDDPEAARFEVQVGSTPAARIGNTVTHLLESEGESSVAILDPTAVLAARPRLDQASMQLRRNEVVVGPSVNGEVFYAGFTESIDFSGIDGRLDIETIVDRANDAGLAVSTLEMAPTLRTAAQLRSALPVLRARRVGGLPVPERTVARLEELGLRTVENEDSEISVERS